jgi:hypothetical protein
MLMRHPMVQVRRLCSVVFTVVALGACTADQMVAPEVPTVAASVATSKSTTSPANKSALTAFIEAQGTWCDRSLPGDCYGLDELGVGYYLFWCADAFCAEPLGMGMDFGGVNPRFWKRSGFAELPEFTPTGSVNETITKEGRRRLVINLRSRNTFVALLDLTDLSFPFGTGFLEYPDRLPVLGEATLSADITLPEGYVGMPDMYQVLYDPVVFFDITHMTVTSKGTGTLRSAVRGIPAGTKVAVDGEFHVAAGSKYSDQRQKFFRNSNSRGLGGAGRVILRPVP